MKKNTKTHFLMQSAMIATLYIVLTFSQELILPGTTSMAIQLRLSEILCLLSVFTPSAIFGLTIGTLVTNILSIGALPLDMIFGTLATFVAVSLSYRFKNVRWFKLPVLSSLMPVFANGIIIGLELEIFLIEGSFHIGSFLLQGGCVALGEFVVCVVFGLPFFRLIQRSRLFKDNNA